METLIIVRMEQKDEVTTNEIMDFLKDHMVTKEEFFGLEKRVDRLETKVDKLDKKVDRLEEKIHEVKVDTATLLRNKELITKQEGLEYIRGTV